jgi:hypothetical protein
MTRPFIPHNGGPCPVKPHVLVDVMFADSREWHQLPARTWSAERGVKNNDYWRHIGPANTHIIGWRFSFPQRRTIWQRIASIFKRKDTQ